MRTFYTSKEHLPFKKHVPELLHTLNRLKKGRALDELLWLTQPSTTTLCAEINAPHYRFKKKLLEISEQNKIALPLMHFSWKR